MTTVTTICTNEVWEYSAWRHAERHELEIYCRRSGEQFSCWIGRAYSHADPRSMRPVCAARPNAPRKRLECLLPRRIDPGSGGGWRSWNGGPSEFLLREVLNGMSGEIHQKLARLEWKPCG
jgi:hypothetical protein